MSIASLPARRSVDQRPRASDGISSQTPSGGSAQALLRGLKRGQPAAGLLLSLERLNRFRLGYWGVVLAAFVTFVAFHAVWEMYEHSMDRFFGTNLQPGGMVEATDNNFFAIVGALLALAILHYWHRARSFEAYLVAPTSGYLGRLFVGQRARAQVELTRATQTSEEFRSEERRVGKECRL